MQRAAQIEPPRRRASGPGARPIRVGFVPLFDCAPLVVARELGFFARHGIAVQLVREIGWATVRDKILYRELDAAHALAPMLFAAACGLGSIRAECLTGLVLTLEGNAITLSAGLSRAGVTDAASLREHALTLGRPLVFGIPFLHSSHHFLLHAWLESCGFDPGRDVRLAVVPPPQMPANLKTGHLDGFCVGEPWNSVAAIAKSGWRVAASASIAPRHPEKVLMVRREFAEARGEEHVRLIAAILEAARFCADPAHHAQVLELLSRPEYVNAPMSALRRGFEGCLVGDAYSTDVHEPTASQALWILRNLVRLGLLSNQGAAAAPPVTDLFRTDIFHKAIRYAFQNEHAVTTPV